MSFCRGAFFPSFLFLWRADFTSTTQNKDRKTKQSILADSHIIPRLFEKTQKTDGLQECCHQFFPGALERISTVHLVSKLKTIPCVRAPHVHIRIYTYGYLNTTYSNTTEYPTSLPEDQQAYHHSHRRFQTPQYHHQTLAFVGWRVAPHSECLIVPLVHWGLPKYPKTCSCEVELPSHPTPACTKTTIRSKAYDKEATCCN